MLIYGKREIQKFTKIENKGIINNEINQINYPYLQKFGQK